MDRADAIVLARVEAASPTAEGLIGARIVPLTLLKGATLPHDIQFKDAWLSNDRMRATPSDPRNLVDANPDAFTGACNRYIFDKDMILVVFLKRQGGTFVPDGSPFSRSLEDVPSSDALWVKAVKLYVEIDALPPQQRRAEMERRRDMLGYELDDPDARLLSHELERALSSRR